MLSLGFFAYLVLSYAHAQTLHLVGDSTMAKGGSGSGHTDGKAYPSMPCEVADFKLEAGANTLLNI